MELLGNFVESILHRAEGVGELSIEGLGGDGIIPGGAMDDAFEIAAGVGDLEFEGFEAIAGFLMGTVGPRLLESEGIEALLESLTMGANFRLGLSPELESVIDIFELASVGERIVGVVDSKLSRAEGFPFAFAGGELTC